MKFNVITFGCKVNAYESNFIIEDLSKNGFELCKENDKCDILIVNTCTVTDTSDKKCLKMVRRLKRENPKCLLAVIGCSSQNNPEKYESIGVDILLGTKKKSELLDIIKNYKEKYTYVTKERDTVFEDMEITAFDQVRAYVKIQDGCNNFCSYCVIPFVRGDIRSKNFDKCISEITSLVNKGYKEIVLTGIHTGTYFDNGHDLTDLILELSKINGLERIRLSSTEITELNDKFMEMLKTDKVFCDHLHIPLQAGSDEILRIMNRKYDTKYFLEKVKTIREIIPDISITTDVIVGHNYETDELFEQTYNFCKKIGFSKIHVFPFSKRSGTASAKMSGEIPENIKKERVKKLMALSNSLEKEYYNRFLGTKKEVLIEQVKDGKSIGHTSNYLLVELDEVLEVGKSYLKEIR